MELEGVEGVEGKLKVWIRRVWTLEMVWNILSPSSSSIETTICIVERSLWLTRLSTYLHRALLDFVKTHD